MSSVPRSASSASAPAVPVMSGRDWLLLLLLATVWGASYFFVKVAVEDVGPFTVAFVRVLLAGLLLFAIMKVRGLSLPRSRDTWIAYLVLGLTNSALPYSLIFWGETRIPSGLAGILTAMVPVWTVLAAHVMTTDERLTSLKVAGITLGMLGVVVIMGEDLGSFGDGSALGKLAVVLATALYGFSNVFARRVKRRPPLELAWGQMAAATLWMLPLALIDRPWSTAHWSRDAVAAILALTLVSTVLAYLIYFRLLATVGATNTSQIGFLIPISSLILGAVFLGEDLVPVQLAGFILIVTGMALIDGRIVRRLRARLVPELST
ncbi:MAG: EamA family transporter [Thermomicrobiales bacterium]